MLTAAKNQFKVILLSVKYNIMREMTNRVSFFMNIGFMVLNNATFILQWMILFTLKKDIGGYALNDVLLLWGLAAGTYGISHIFFQNSYSLAYLILNGKLDAYLVQPKNVLLSVITSGTSVSAIGDLIYGYLIVVIFHFSIVKLLLFTYFIILGGLILTAFAVIAGSICFWIVRGDTITDNLNNIMVNFATYPDGIFKGAVRFLLYTLVPVGLTVYMPLQVILHFNIRNIMLVTGFTALLIILAFFIFYRGLRRYTSSSLMNARI